MRRMKNLQDTLENAVFHGQARIITSPEKSGIVYYLKDKWLEGVVRMQIDLLRNTQDTFCGTSRQNWYPETQNNEEWEGEHDFE